VRARPASAPAVNIVWGIFVLNVVFLMWFHNSEAEALRLGQQRDTPVRQALAALGPTAHFLSGRWRG
jgi:hypothetical protein